MDGLKIDEMGFADLVAAERVLRERAKEAGDIAWGSGYHSEHDRWKRRASGLELARRAVRSRIDALIDALVEEATCTTPPAEDPDAS